MHRYNPEWHSAHMGCNCCGGLMLSALLCSSWATHHCVPLLKRGPVRSLCLPAAHLGSVRSTVVVMMFVRDAARGLLHVSCAAMSQSPLAQVHHLGTRCGPGLHICSYADAAKAVCGSFRPCT